MPTFAAARHAAVVRLPRARLDTTSGALDEGRPAVEDGGGGSWHTGAVVDAATPDTHDMTVELARWVHDLAAVDERVAARADEVPGRAAWTQIAEVLRALDVLLHLGPTPHADLADETLVTLGALLAGDLLPTPLVLAEPHDFLLTRYYFGTPTSAPCADLLLLCAADLADALDKGSPPEDLADLLLDAAVTLDGYRAAARTLARAYVPAPASRTPGGAAL